MININKIQEVKERADIVQVAHRMNIRLDRSLKAKCPFHNEKTASFSINKNKQIFKCFGCGVGGDCITLVSKLLDVNAYEAAKNINDLLGLGVDFGTKTSSYDLDKYKHEQFIKEEFKKWENKAYGILCSYFKYLVDKNEEYEAAIIDYYLELLREGHEEDKKQFYTHKRKWVNELGKRGFG